MKHRKVLTLIALIIILLCSCGGNTGPQWTADQVIVAFQSANLEAESISPLTKDDYGLAPYVCTGIHFLIPSLCPDCGGRVFACDSQADQDKLEEFYVTMGQESALFFSWVHTKDNILVQINGDLPEDQAQQYQTALNNLQP